MTVNQLLVFYNRSFINSNFTILFHNSLDEINGIVQKSVVYTMKHEQAAGLCWLSFWLILFNGTAIRLNQISAAHFRKFSTKIFSGRFSRRADGDLELSDDVITRLQVHIVAISPSWALSFFPERFTFNGFRIDQWECWFETDQSEFRKPTFITTIFTFETVSQTLKTST